MSALMQLLDRPIAYQPSFVGLGVGVTGAVLLSQLVYWHNRMDAGWFYKTQKEIRDETGLTREEQETARRRLISAGVLEEDRRGVPAKLYFRVKADALELLLLKKIKEKTQNAGNPHSSMRESRIQECGNAADKNAENPQTSLRESSAPDCVLFRQSGNLLPHALRQRDGLFTVKTGTSDFGHAFTQTRVTPRGIHWIAERYASELMAS